MVVVDTLMPHMHTIFVHEELRNLNKHLRHDYYNFISDIIYRSLIRVEKQYNIT